MVAYNGDTKKEKNSLDGATFSNLEFEELKNTCSFGYTIQLLKSVKLLGSIQSVCFKSYSFRTLSATTPAWTVFRFKIKVVFVICHCAPRTPILILWLPYSIISKWSQSISQSPHNQVTAVLFSDMIWNIRNQYKQTFGKIWILKYYKNHFCTSIIAWKRLCGKFLKNLLIISWIANLD